MKKLVSISLAIVILLTLSGCSKTSVSTDAPVTLNFIYGDQNISVDLPDEEAARIIGILDGNRYEPIWAGTPACGFTENVSLRVGYRVFAVACDDCNCIEDLGVLRFFEIPQEDMEYIRSLFRQYGGYFPCV